MKTVKRILAGSIALFSLLTADLSAQVPNSMYFLHGVPQSNRINPATTPGCSFYLGFPGLAPLRFQLNSSSLDYNDVFYYDDAIDSLLLFAHPDIEESFLNAFLGNLEQKNYFGTDVSLSLASIGFKAGKSFISFDITTRVDNKLYYPGGIFNYLLDPDDTGELISLSGLGADVTIYNEVALGWSRKDFIIPNLDLGIRGKVLFGIANLNTAESILEITPTRDTLGIRANTRFDVAAPSLVTFSDGDTLPGIEVAENYFDSFDPSSAGLSGYLDLAAPAFSQRGFGLDVGLNYRPIPQLRISASLVDFGYIRWKNTLTGILDFDYGFTGLEVNPFTGVDTSFIQDMTDELFSSLDFTANEGYISRLNTKLFVGAAFYPIEKIGFGILSRTDFLNDQISQQFTGSVNMTTGKFINLSLSYSYLSRSFNNLGAGLSLNLGPFNMYLISDNLVSAALWPTDARSVNFWYGMNLTFGWKRARKPKGPGDRPMIF